MCINVGLNLVTDFSHLRVMHWSIASSPNKFIILSSAEIRYLFESTKCLNCIINYDSLLTGISVDHTIRLNHPESNYS